MAEQISRLLTIENELGLHARPAALFVQTTHKYPDAEVKVVKDGEVVDGKSIMGVLMLCAEAGSSIEVVVMDEEPDKLLDELEELIKNKFYED